MTMSTLDFDFYLACAKGQTKKVQKIIINNAKFFDINKCALEYGYYVAMYQGNKQVVIMLLTKYNDLKIDKHLINKQMLQFSKDIKTSLSYLKLRYHTIFGIDLTKIIIQY